ncbi:MAG: helix-turn-helix transcriptional regulator [Coriobacteriia bacterium]|nr:helix-turn-helix transcriptional regulator [Coriobacteriia bacterium]
MNNLNELLEARGLTVSEFARRTGITQPTMHRIVHGQVNLTSISAEHFLRIAHGLGLSAEQLYFGDSSYDVDKSTIDRVYATTTEDGRHAMLANAIGISHAYLSNDGYYLPTIRDDLEAIKGL